jgi:hypothetical protein
VAVDANAGADRGGQQNAPTGGHRRHRRLGGKQLAGHVDAKHSVEIGRSDRLQRPEMFDTGVAGQHVQPAELHHHPLDQVLGLRRVGDVGSEGDRLVALVDKLGDKRVSRRLVGHIVDRDCRAVGGQPAHDRCADSAAAAGYQWPACPPAVTVESRCPPKAIPEYIVRLTHA